MDKIAVKGFLTDNKIIIGIVVVIGLIIISYIGIPSSLQTGQITGVDCENTTLPSDYCDGTTFYSNPSCDDSTITFDETLNSPECGYIAPDSAFPEDTSEANTSESEPADEATATPTPTPEPTVESTPEPIVESTPEHTAVATVKPTPLIEATATPDDTQLIDTKEDKEPNIIFDFLQDIRDKIYEYTNI